MPKECVQCGFISVNDEMVVCDRCGSQKVRFSLLAGLQLPEQEARVQKLKVRESKLPTLEDRFHVAVRYLFWSQVAAFVLTGVLIFITPDSIVSKDRPVGQIVESLVSLYPGPTRLALGAVPAAAAGAAVIFTLRGVYLAQQVGLCLAPVAAILTLIGLRFAGFPMPPDVWVASPLFAAALGFVFGLRVATHLERDDPDQEKEIVYKEPETWDRKARASYFEVAVPVIRPWKRLLLGVAIGLAVMYLLPVLLPTAVTGRFGRFNPKWSRITFQALGIFAAGVAAGSGTKAGVQQGLGVGALLFAARYGSKLGAFDAAMLLDLVQHLALGLVGGVLGRNALHPHRVSKGKIADKNDQRVYVGDELKDS
jgi:hypothetical protein